MKYFPKNTLAQYTTKLARPLTLEGEWEVALVEILCPSSFHNVPAGCALFVGSNVYEVPKGQYNSMQHLLKVINSTPEFKDIASFKYDNVSGHVALQHKEGSPAKPSSQIHTLGDPSDFRIGVSTDLDHVLGVLGYGSIDMPVSEGPADLYYHVPEQLFIYTDIVENQLVGDTSAPLLRTVTVTKGSKNIQKIFSSPHYIKVQRRQFDTIDIDIRTRTGEVAPFRQGLVTCKLHFQKCSSK